MGESNAETAARADLTLRPVAPEHEHLRGQTGRVLVEERRAFDARYARLLATECDTGDAATDRARRDGLIAELLRDLGLTETLAAYRVADI